MTRTRAFCDGDRVVELELPSQPSFKAVGRLVAGGLASRLEFRVDKIEDLQLAVEALLCRAPANGSLRMTLGESKAGLQVTLGLFARVPAERARVERMLHAFVDDVVVQDSDEGEWITMRANRERAA